MFKQTAPDGKLNMAGKHIRAWRLSKDMSLRQMASFLELNGLDWDYQTLSRAERGIRIINDVEIKCLSEILKVSLRKLLS